MKVLVVTAFIDIQRGSWPHWTRTNDEYINWFSNLIQVPEIEIICFCETTIKDQIIEQLRYNGISYDKNRITFTPIFYEDTFFVYIDKESEIMQSANFLDIVGPRRGHPEHCVPAYNCIQHSKVNFVRKAVDLKPNYTHYAWIDFGYLRNKNDIPSSKPSWELLFNDDKIHYIGFRDVIPTEEFDPIQTCKYAPEVIQGSFFIVPKPLVYWYETAYCDMLHKYHLLGIADDDQAIALQVMCKDKDNFTINTNNNWFQVFNMMHNPSGGQ